MAAQRAKMTIPTPISLVVTGKPIKDQGAAGDWEELIIRDMGGFLPSTERMTK